MLLWVLGNDASSELLGLPETGMGFQWVEADGGRRGTRLLVFNAEHAYDLTAVELIHGDDAPMMLTNGQRVVEALRRASAPIIGRPEPSGFRLLENRIAYPARCTDQPVQRERISFGRAAW